MNRFPGSRRQVPEVLLSFCSSYIHTPRAAPMHTPASTKVQKKFLGVKWELGGRVPGLKLLLTFRASRICQIFGVSVASRPRQFQNQLGFSPRGRLSREMRQRCGVACTSKAAPIAPHERHPLAAPPPASLSSAAASAACVDGSTAASSDTASSDTSSSDTASGDTRGGDTQGGDTQGGDTRGGDTRGGAHGIGRARGSEGRGGAVLGPAGKNARRNGGPPPKGASPPGRRNDGMMTMPSELGAVATPTANSCPQLLPEKKPR